MEISFKDLVKLNESIQGEYTKKIRQAKKGECAGIMKELDEYRNMVPSCIDASPEMASIIDGIVDLQEVIDSKLYKFKMN